jgi:hypothetical protein
MGWLAIMRGPVIVLKVFDQYQGPIFYGIRSIKFYQLRSIEAHQPGTVQGIRLLAYSLNCIKRPA